MMGTDFSQLDQLVLACASTSDIATCVTMIEVELEATFAGSRCAVYLLQRDNCRLRLQRDIPGFPTDMALDAQPQGFARYDCFRGPTLVGAVMFARTKPQVVLSAEERHVLNTALGVVVFLYNRHVSVDLLSNSHAPIDFLQSVYSFYDEVRLMTELASGMFAGALRELRSEGPGLATIFAWNRGLAEDTQLATWDLDDYTAIPCFNDAIQTRQSQVIENRAEAPGRFLERPEQRNIVSAVFCPVLVGAEVFGVLSFGLPVPYRYLKLELDGFMVLANAVGVAIHNFRRAAAEAVVVGDGFTISTVITAVEVAQAARHSAKTEIDTSNIKLAGMRLAAAKISGEQRHRWVADIDDLAEASLRIGKALDDIKAATKPPLNELGEHSLERIWSEASRQLRGKIGNQGLQVNWEGADRIVRCYPDQLRHLFLNLIINSVDAFTERRVPGRKTITCKILNTIGDRITLRYVDNAGGLDLQKLRTLYPESQLDAAQLIFERDITTKGDKGSGWGLFLCRRIAARHGGSVDVVDYRRGMTIDVALGLGLASAEKGEN